MSSPNCCRPLHIIMHATFRGITALFSSAFSYKEYLKKNEMFHLSQLIICKVMKPDKSNAVTLVHPIEDTLSQTSVTVKCGSTHLQTCWVFLTIMSCFSFRICIPLFRYIICSQQFQELFHNSRSNEWNPLPETVKMSSSKKK